METIILFAPLIGALICGFGYKWIGETLAMWVATGFLFLAAILSWVVFVTFDASAHDGGFYTVTILRWIESGSLATDWAIRMDALTATMLIEKKIRTLSDSITSFSSSDPMYSVAVLAMSERDSMWSRLSWSNG